MTFRVLAVVGAVSAPACGGTLEDDYRRQQRVPGPGAPTTAADGVSAPLRARLPTTIGV